MESKINEGSRPLTFDEADELGGYTLAARWADRSSWPMPGEENASDELAELAYMSALARWLARWQPIPIHRAILAGAAPEAVAAAFGGTVAEAFACWHQWVTAQRAYGRPGVADDEYETVAAAFAAAGVTEFEEPCRD